MKRLGYVALCATYFSLAPLLHRLGALPASLLTVALAALLALLASGTVDAVAVMFGASAAFAGTLLGAVSPPLATAVFVALLFGERTLRVRTSRARLAHVGLALVSGGAAGLVVMAYRGASLPTLAVAGLVAAVLVSAPFLLEADDPMAHALSLASRETRGPVAALFARGAELRRVASDVPLDRATAREVEDTWRALLGLATARLRLDRRERAASPAAESILAKLDERIGRHVDVLARAYTAVDTAHAARAGADDRSLQRVADDHAAMDDESEALAEVEAALRADAALTERAG